MTAAIKTNPASHLAKPGNQNPEKERSAQANEFDQWLMCSVKNKFTIYYTTWEGME